jgi:hypothetical protein
MEALFGACAFATKLWHEQVRHIPASAALLLDRTMVLATISTAKTFSYRNPMQRSGEDLQCTSVLSAHTLKAAHSFWDTQSNVVLVILACLRNYSAGQQEEAASYAPDCTWWRPLDLPLNREPQLHLPPFTNWEWHCVL